jgi:hypothetical protein
VSLYPSESRNIIPGVPHIDRLAPESNNADTLVSDMDICMYGRWSLMFRTFDCGVLVLGFTMASFVAMDMLMVAGIVERDLLSWLALGFAPFVAFVVDGAVEFEQLG